MSKSIISLLFLLFLAGCADSGYNPGYIISDTSTEPVATEPQPEK